MSLPLILTLLGLFVGIALLTGTVSAWVLAQTAPGRRRLRQAAAGPSGVLLENTPLTAEPSEVLKRMTSLVPRSPKEMTRLRRRFVRAGYYTLTPIALYTTGQVVFTLLFALAPMLYAAPTRVWPVMALAGLMGFQVPGFILQRQITKRQKLIRNGLPDALDLLIVCLEAGSALDQAILKTSEELTVAHPALAEELKLVITETRAGKPRLEAFRNFADRTGVDDVRALVAMLIQTDRFGTSVGQALRTHAETSRTKRRQRAEERAAKIGVKLVFPLVFLLFPALFVVTLGPSVILFIRIFFGQIMAR